MYRCGKILRIFFVVIRIKHEMAIIWKRRKHTSENIQSILPPAVYSKIAIEYHQDLISKSETIGLFAEYDCLLVDVISALVPQIRNQMETFVYENSKINHWMVLEQGEIQLFSQHSCECVKLSPGDSLGEVPLFLNHGTWPFSVKAMTISILYRIPIDDMRHMLSPFADLQSTLTDRAHKRMELFDFFLS